MCQYLPVPTTLDAIRERLQAAFPDASIPVVQLSINANKPLELDFPSGKVVMSVAEMITALKDDEDAERSRNQP